MKRLLLLLMAIGLTPGAPLAGTFQDLGAGLSVSACSANGDVVVGTYSGGGAFRWSVDGGLEPIGGLEALDVSEDGNVIAGTIDVDGLETAAYWTEADGWQMLGEMPGGASCDASLSSSYGTNGDGSIVVGLGWIASCRAHGFRWDADSGMVDLGSTVADRSSRANDVSGDGSLVIGWQDASTGYRQGARWVEGVQNLFVDGNGDPVGEAQASNPDGSVVVGGSTYGMEAWRWTGSGAVEAIGNLPGFDFRSTALGVSDDGTVVVGFSGFGADRDAFIWIEGEGMTKLDNWIVAQGITDAGGVDLGTATGISANGRVIVGWGFVGFQYHGWRIDLDETVGVEQADRPLAVQMLAPRPNPFRAGVTISYELDEPSPVAVTIHDAAGRVVRRLTDGFMSAGAHSTSWDGCDDHERHAAAGTYFVRLSTPIEHHTRSVTLTR
jgi:probable HAF family extracellular repeat protein